MNVIIKIDNRENAITAALEDDNGLVTQHSDMGRFIALRTSFDNAIEIAISRQLNMQLLLDLQPEYTLTVDQKLRWFNTNYISFRKSDMVMALPPSSILLREKFKVYDENELQIEYPTLQQIAESIDSNVLSYIKLYQGIEYVIVPTSLSADRVVVTIEGELKHSSEIEEFNALVTMVAKLEGAAVTSFKPRSTVFTYKELIEFNWDQA